ncbi:unnamed protein product [Notodromas monacha]|uniref:Protein-tyrosine-phosphatase n=1 Tax=Notodromas monacha TaxID=399045 RepID=A0A7R9BLQ3_9CRUS|nr:unnamed protein product [Notodromas monacha]CAG0917800.1 unnamed protein product [Notodromas monacha]
MSKQVPSGKPTITQAHNESATSISLQWVPPPSETLHGEFTGYEITYRARTDSESDAVKVTISERSYRDYVIKDLRPFTQYVVSLAVKNPEGIGPNSSLMLLFVLIASLNRAKVPSGKPTITQAHNESATSISLQWVPPPSETLHGEFTGYEITYRSRTDSESDAVKVTISERSYRDYVIKDLRPFTQYVVSLAVKNPEGIGPASTVVVMTDEGVPSAPRNLTVSRTTDKSAELSWLLPLEPNGVVTGFRVYFVTPENLTDYRTVPHTKGDTRVSYPLAALRPFTEYDVWVKAFTWKHEGEPSEHVHFTTDVGGPGPPKILNVTCQPPRSLMMYWQRPAVIFGGLDFYYIYYRDKEVSWEFAEEVPVDTNPDKMVQSMLLTNLTDDVVYEVRVRGAAISLFNREKFHFGNWSKTGYTLVTEDCKSAWDLMATQLPSLHDSRSGAFDVERVLKRFLELEPTLLAGIGSSLAALLLVTLAFFLWRRTVKSHTTRSEAKNGRVPMEIVSNSKSNDGSGLTGNNHTPNNDLSMTERHKNTGNEHQLGTLGPVLSNAIAADKFAEHVAALHANGDEGFYREFQDLQSFSAELEHSAEMAKLPDNKDKNRYQNVVAYDHSLVPLMQSAKVLNTTTGNKSIGGEYINANLVDGWKKPNAFIATQGPLQNTLPIFWQMVLEHNVRTIVMITNLVEHGKNVSFAEPGSHPPQPNAEIEVKQWHFTAWPDHGTPPLSAALLQFVQESLAANPPNAGPILVHCRNPVESRLYYLALHRGKDVASVGKMPYCFVRGGVDTYDCYVTSLSKEEARSLFVEFKCSQKDIEDKHCNKAAIRLPGGTEAISFKLCRSIKIIEPANFVINVLERKFGYRVVSATGDDPTVWTMHRQSTSKLVSQVSSANLLQIKERISPLSSGSLQNLRDHQVATSPPSHLG